LEEAFTQTDAIFKESLSYQDELVLFQGLKRAVDFLTHEKNLHIILLFERLELYIPMLTDDFFVHLRSLRDTAKYKFSVVFSLTRPLEDLVETNMLTDFYEFFAGKSVFLSLADLPGIKFRIEYLQKLLGRSLGETCINDLIQITGGHGKLTRLAVEALLANEKEITSNERLTEYLLSEKSVTSGLREIWDFLTPFEKSCFQQICNKQACDNISFLEQVGLIKNGESTILLLSSYVIKNNTNSEKEKVTYDPALNLIKKGSQIISEQLTSSEFRLFRFLIENPGKILTREEIITSVWKDMATTEGVTDQALDQLIFRLRKKIEDNPNNPERIQTIKGRGIKFLG
jgi:DNA-binding winged helix-turn-helix (wHTH) protein